MTTPINDDQILALAPTLVRTARSAPYDGAGASVAMAAFPPEARSAISDTYQVLLNLYAQLAPAPGGPFDFLAFQAHHGWPELMARLREIRLDSVFVQRREVGQALHDIRGGSLQALALYLQFSHMMPLDAADQMRVFLLVRDQLKIIRSCVPDLDPPRIALDREERAHGVGLLLEKWQNVAYQIPGFQSQIVVDCRYDGVVADRCVAFAALDRVLYNLLNNATRYADDGHIWVTILPIRSVEGVNLRFAVANRIAPAQAQQLHERFGPSWSELFRGGFTTGGSGIGLAICTEIVGNAFGLHNVDEVIEARYLGATRLNDSFVAWFHWPVSAP